MPQNLMDDVEDFLNTKDELQEEADVDEGSDADTEQDTEEGNAPEPDTDADTADDQPTDPYSSIYEELELNKHYPGGVEAALRSIPEHRRHNEQLRKENQERDARLRQLEQDNREMLQAIKQQRTQQTVDFEDDPRQFVEQNYVPMDVAQDMYKYMMDMERRLGEVYNQTGEVKFASRYKDFDQVKDAVYDRIQSDPYLQQIPREKALEYAYHMVRPAQAQTPQPTRPVAPADQHKKQFAQTTTGKGGRQAGSPQFRGPASNGIPSDDYQKFDIEDWERRYSQSD